MSSYATVVQATGRPGKATTRKSGDLPKCSPYPGAGGAAGNGCTVAVASFAVCGAPCTCRHSLVLGRAVGPCI